MMVDDPGLEDEPHEPHDWRQDYKRWKETQSFYIEADFYESGGLSESFNESDAAAADDFYNREKESDR